MTDSRCNPAVRLFLVFGLLVLAATSQAQQHNPILEKIAKIYGIDSWDKIEAIRYTWNGEITGLFKLSRTWTWEPKTNKVSYQGKDCLLYTSDAADEEDSVDLGGRRIIK